MIEKLLNKIKEYNTIIIHRHSRPDLDALGSQRGLALSIKATYPTKNVYMVGDMSERYSFLGQMDEIDNNIYNNALAIITDVAVANMVSDERYKNAKEVFVIDHHKNPTDITENFISNSDKVSVCELVAEILLENNFIIPKDAATAFYGGIVTDSGRFQYGNNIGSALITAGKLLNLGANKDYIYNNLYVETLEERRIKNWFAARFEVTKSGVAYLKNTEEVFEKFPQLDFFNVSRGMVNLMAGIKEIKIWCNFTYDKANNKVVGEFRARDIKIVDIAKKYGGGGHDVACGATLSSFEEANLVIKDFEELLGA